MTQQPTSGPNHGSDPTAMPIAAQGAQPQHAEPQYQQAAMHAGPQYQQIVGATAINPKGQIAPLGVARPPGLTLALAFITFGIYGLFVQINQMEEMKRWRGEGMSGAKWLLFSCLPFLNIYALWKYSDTIGDLGSSLFQVANLPGVGSAVRYEASRDVGK